MQTTSRQEAIQNNMTRYYTGKPCVRGHVAERMVSTKTCVDCKNEREKSRPARVLTDDQRKRKANLAKQSRQNFPERHAQNSKKSYLANKKIRNDWSLQYRKKRMIVDNHYALKMRVQSLVNQSLRIKSISKKSRTMQIIGCSLDELKLHIEKQFCDGMTWDNRNKWHIDHIVPLATATTEQDVISLNHFSNLRPLWAKDNLAKGAKNHFLI
jgi:hypothetical protein